MSGLGAYLVLEIRRTVRNPRFLLFTVAFPLGFYLLFTMLYGDTSMGSGPGAIAFSAYYMVAMAAYGGLSAALNSNASRLAAERAGGWSRQLRVTPLAPAAYVLGKTIGAVGVVLPSIVLVCLAGAVVHHVSGSAATWIALVAALWIGSIPFAVLGVLLGYALDTESAQSGGMIVFFALSILGGLWFPYQIMPHWMQDIARVLPSYHYAALGWNAVAHQALGWRHIAVLLAYTAVFGLWAARRYRRDEAREYA